VSYAELFARYKRKHKRLVEPRQGFDSLDESLWLAYSMGRKRGFTDLGTYVNKPGDHGWNDRTRTAAAFDLGREDRFLFKGWGYLKARRLAMHYWPPPRARDRVRDPRSQDHLAVAPVLAPAHHG
jgi:hypothetical protein